MIIIPQTEHKVKCKDKMSRSILWADTVTVPKTLLHVSMIIDNNGDVIDELSLTAHHFPKGMLHYSTLDQQKLFQAIISFLDKHSNSGNRKMRFAAIYPNVTISSLVDYFGNINYRKKLESYFLRKAISVHKILHNRYQMSFKAACHTFQIDYDDHPLSRANAARELYYLLMKGEQLCQLSQNTR